MQPKRQIPDPWEDVESIKYIGRYLADALNDEGLYTVQDVVNVLAEIGQPHEDAATVRSRIRDWLEILLMNARPLECCYPQSKIIDGEECSYKSRFMNFRGFNAIVDVMRYYAVQPYRDWVPRRKRGFNERNKYPRQCIL